MIQLPKVFRNIAKRFEHGSARFAKSTRKQQIYLIACLMVLLAATLLWAILGAKLHTTNADQLVDPYLFKDAKTFHEATFPTAHTQLLKWPIFWLVGAFGATAMGFIVATVALVLITVAGLVWLLWRIDRRPLVFGTFCLALALVLMLIPAQPYAGGLLPVNMAMLATRNIEYLFFVGALILLVKAPKLKSWQFWAAGVVLTILFASDQLFVSLSIGGALCVLVLYALRRGWRFVTLAARWLLASAGALVAAIVLLGVIHVSGLTHLTTQTGPGPYAVVHTGKDLVLGLVYAGAGVATNLGANPASDATIVANIPGRVVARLLSPAGFAFGATFVMAIFAFRGVGKVFRSTVVIKKGRPPKTTEAVELFVMLLAASVTALVVFMASSHYYAVDARYLSVVLFAVLVGIVSFLKSRAWQPHKLFAVAGVLSIALISGVYVNVHDYGNNSAALVDFNGRNKTIAQALAQHPVSVLVGDYWRVVPAHSLDDRLRVMPMESCVTPRTSLSSQAWQPDLNKQSFAYLLSSDRTLTDFPSCSLAEVTAVYGRPNASLLIAGTLEHPKEQLLFYDHGIHHSAPGANRGLQINSTVAPIGLDDLMGTRCSVPTVMNIVAHQDDDLLFLSPDLLHSVQAGYCVRTVFLTAGDSGHGKFYWLNRQLGAEAAYDTMLGSKEIWLQRTVKLGDNQFVTVANPRGNPRVSLIFFNMPDGDIHGDGFHTSNYETLAKLKGGEISSITTVDGQSAYTSSQVIEDLSSLINTYRPSELRTQADVASADFPDHSDHVTAGWYATRALERFNTEQHLENSSIPLVRYIGYPIHGYEGNVSDKDFDEKEAAFLSYATFDGGVCRTVAECRESSTYGAYLARQYKEGEQPSY